MHLICTCMPCISGELEVLLDMNTYMQSVVCTEKVEVLVLEMKHYERLFVRRHPRTIDAMRRMLEVKLETRRSLLANKDDVPFLSNVQTKLVALNNPKSTSNKKEKPLPSEKAAEKEFLNHKGPLIDIYGPGSVFYMIRVREKSKLHRTSHMNRKVVKDKNSGKQNDHLHSVRLPQTLLMAAQMAGALKDRDIGFEHAQRPLSARSSNSRAPRSFRRIQSAIKAEFEDNTEADEPPEVGDEVMTRKSWPQENHQQTSVSFVDSEEDESLSKLEDRVREWLEHGNPKSGPQVAHLKRLEIKVRLLLIFRYFHTLFLFCFSIANDLCKHF